jgi:hypothetical protein
VYVDIWWVIERTSSNSNEWLLEKKKNAYPDAVHAFRECDFFSPTAHQYYRSKAWWYDEFEEEKKHKARFQVVGEDGVAELLQRGTGTVQGQTNVYRSRNWWRWPGPYLGILRHRKKKNFVPPPLICSYSVMCKQKQHKKLTKDKTL